MHTAVSHPGRWMGALCSAVILSAPAASLAAAAQKETRKPRGRFRVGPVYLTPKLLLKNAGVDTNVFNQRSDEIPDTSVVLSPTLLAALPVGRRFRFTGEGHVDFNYFRRQSSERSTDFGAEGRGEVDFGPCTFFGAGGGGQSRQRFAIDIDQRVLRHEQWGTLGVKFSPAPRLSTTVSGMGRVYEFGSFLIDGVNVKDSLDRNELTGSVQVRYALTRQTTLVASGDVIEDRFLSQPLAASRLARSYRFLGGFELGAKALIRGKVLAGVRRFPASGSVPQYEGPALAIAASVPLRHYGLLTTTAERDIYYALSPVVIASDRFRNTYASTRLGAEATVNLPLSLFGRGTFGFEQAKYLLPYPFGTTIAPRVDHLWSTGASLLRAFRTGVRVGGTVQWIRRVSSFPAFSYQGLRYGLQAEVAP
jgi:Putative beta-barrel porin 2